ncbi:hypothetical protein NE237_006176 [Protea cynaroides]|uniref:Poly(A) RNA polymerase mitochondrial-like central palm domain-containing protein n=1 Tax=Protea cynaroides TaxID=273540 RepID=A0A9Q0QV65_9MAGN|nr:hypothetical protein NE237_006176 [Protea cynaroides]
MHQFLDNWPSILFAMAGGIVLSLGNLSIQYAWAFVGLSVSSVITASITVVIGTTINYFLDGRINRVEILFPGVGCFLIAVFLASPVHSSNDTDNKVKLSEYSDSQEGTGIKEVSKEFVQSKGATIEPFGSFVSRLYSKWSDLDISVEVPSGSFVSSARKRQKLHFLMDIQRALWNRVIVLFLHDNNGLLLGIISR